MTDDDIGSLLARFEDGTLPRAEWTHGAHLVVALWYLRRHSRDEAMDRVRDGIRRYNERQGNHTGYHETITLAWVEVVDRFLHGRDGKATDASLAASLLDRCGRPDYLLRFYSRDRLFSAEARAGWLPPDLEAIG
ncbi:hypothetical protein OJF2_73150 [Aquisphaera giovannonii]|uniref:Uncharacterized protein n=1 Tax=Aquisphaera giovannonii TaxID=406548 RepID=A0A5B9WEN6_9BACT|nr:hypothetical protein [Aquisphaera giovannonii]QEH38709.1 hypothetical protein OJF2_73150 [Aquisphaera giovannonii]